MMYVLISTNKGDVIRLSADELDLSGCSWCLSAMGYPVGRYNGKPVRLHQLVAERMAGGPISTGMFVDHIDGNPLNCHRDNLRIVTPRQNTHNKKPHKNSRTGYKGILTNGSGHHWWAAITHDGELKRYGPYETPIEAARMYDQKAKEYFGEYARINGV